MCADACSVAECNSPAEASELPTQTLERHNQPQACSSFWQGLCPCHHTAVCTAAPPSPPLLWLMQRLLHDHLHPASYNPTSCTVYANSVLYVHVSITVPVLPALLYIISHMYYTYHYNHQ